ncbi:MAG: 2-hydroxyacyl-CoA dehydratase [Deltaproteobacteria bacterium]|nr:2-hydroxyacyl-CoA dehydratase [Deltaproteobacteria bacterium]
MTEKIGFACAYTPLALIDAAGFSPYRILPLGEFLDRAGHVLHDNLCPHVKKILDRALENDLPPLAGLVFMNSCEAMRRLSDAWAHVRPNDRLVLLDLPLTASNPSLSFFKGELLRLADLLSDWRGRKITTDDIENSLARLATLSDLFLKLRDRQKRSALEGGSAKLQRLYNQSMMEPLDETLRILKEELSQAELKERSSNPIPLFIFGNILPDPEVFSIIESCGATIIDEDLCTGSRMFAPLEMNSSGDIFERLARAILTRAPCARTFDSASPLAMADNLVTRARASKVRGIIGHVVKFCDPYLSRFSTIREVLKNAGIPFLILEGDCTLRSVGQQRTRIEAFIEMLR